MSHTHNAFEINAGGWHYASVSKHGGHPLGYCVDHPGHATEHEARECFAQWQRDHVVLDQQYGNWCDCKVCGEATKAGARIDGDGWSSAPLCAAHLTKEDAIVALGIDRPAGSSFFS